MSLKNLVMRRFGKDLAIDLGTANTLVYVREQGIDSNILQRRRVVIGIPSVVTEVEKRAVEEAAKNAGAREVYLIEEPMAAAIGARLPIFEALGTMVVDIGGGTAEIAVISLGGLVSFKSLRIAGDKMNEDIMQMAREKHNLLLGERSAEEVKIAVGAAVHLKEKLEAS